MATYPMPVLDQPTLSAAVESMVEAGVRMVTGSVVDMAGVARSKSVPVARTATFHRSGMGASPTWNVFCIDNAVAFTPRFTVAGDIRLRADLAAARVLGDGMAWAPAEMFNQDGSPAAVCPRGLLRRTQSGLETAGYLALFGCELEFVLTQSGGSALATRPWNAYGLSSTLDAEAFLVDLLQCCEDVSLPIEQIHAEYGDGQYEFAIAPADPLTAADHVVLARILVGRVARRHGMAASFSPVPFAGGTGNGAHQHMSLTRAGRPLFSGGEGPYGITVEGGAVIGAIVAGLPELIAVFAGSVLSGQRLQPGHWSGAFACWGLENREAAVRFCAATAGNPHGASVEVKCVDASANPYLAIATILGLALDGLTRGVALPPEVVGDPAALTAAEAAASGIVRLAADQRAALDALAASTLAPRLLGADILEATLAVRQHELDTYADDSTADLAERFRFAWSV